jgi:hypothetical protein
MLMETYLGFYDSGDGDSVSHFQGAHAYQQPHSKKAIFRRVPTIALNRTAVSTSESAVRET